MTPEKKSPETEAAIQDHRSKLADDHLKVESYLVNLKNSYFKSEKATYPLPDGTTMTAQRLEDARETAWTALDEASAAIDAATSPQEAEKAHRTAQLKFGALTKTTYENLTSATDFQANKTRLAERAAANFDKRITEMHRVKAEYGAKSIVVRPKKGAEESRRGGPVKWQPLDVVTNQLEKTKARIVDKISSAMSMEDLKKTVGEYNTLTEGPLFQGSARRRTFEGPRPTNPLTERFKAQFGTGPNAQGGAVTPNEAHVKARKALEAGGTSPGSPRVTKQ
jgi:hypothetical protein